MSQTWDHSPKLGRLGDWNFRHQRFTMFTIPGSQGILRRLFREVFLRKNDIQMPPASILTSDLLCTNRDQEKNQGTSLIYFYPSVLIRSEVKMDLSWSIYLFIIIIIYNWWSIFMHTRPQLFFHFDHPHYTWKLHISSILGCRVNLDSLGVIKMWLHIH